MTSHRFFKMVAAALQYYFWFPILVNATVFGRSKSISKQNFVDISQFMADIYLLPFCKKNFRVYEFYFRVRFRS